MLEWERWVNAALSELDADHRARRMGYGEYTRRRRDLLASAVGFSDGGATLRRNGAMRRQDWDKLVFRPPPARAAAPSMHARRAARWLAGLLWLAAAGYAGWLWRH